MARITLERDTPIAPFTITCGIYGWMVHTRFFGNQLNALLNYEEMKTALAKIVLMISSGDGPLMSAVSSAIEEFIKAYPCDLD